MFQTAIWFEIPYSLYTIKQAAARIRRPTNQADVIEEIYINIPDTIIADALSLVMEKFTAASIFRGENTGQALLTVRGSGNFTSEIINRVMDRAQGHTDDLETLFARYNESELASETFITSAPQTDHQAERVRQIADEFQQRASEVTNWVAAQLSLF
jgi:hypothetical protein